MKSLVRKYRYALAAFVLISSLAFGIWWAFFSMEVLPAGEFIGRFDSPSGRYSLMTYRTSGDLSDFAVRGAVKDNKNPNGPPKNIYWEYPCRDAVVDWLDDDTVRIDGKVLNVRHDVYDWRQKKHLEN